MRWPRDCSTNPDPLDILLNSLDLYLDFCFQNKILKYWQNTLRLIFQVSKNICPHPFKKFSFCHKLCFSNPFTFATRCRRPQIFQTMISVRLKNVSLKYQSCKDIGIRKLESVKKIQFLYLTCHLHAVPPGPFPHYISVEGV